MGFFNDFKQASRWIGDKAKKTVKWVGDNKKVIKKVAGYIEKGAPLVAGGLAATGVGAPAAGFVAGLGKGAGYIKDNLDGGLKKANKAIKYYDKGMKYANEIEDKIQKVKKK